MDEFALIIFGITGNLAQIKLIPALYDMAEKGLLPKNMSIVGIARSVMNKEFFKRYFLDSLNTQNIHHQHVLNHPIKKHFLIQVESFLVVAKQQPFRSLHSTTSLDVRT